MMCFIHVLRHILPAGAQHSDKHVLGNVVALPRNILSAKVSDLFNLITGREANVIPDAALEQLLLAEAGRHP